MSERDFSRVASAFKPKTCDQPSLQGVLGEVLSAISRNDFAAISPHFTDEAELHIRGFESISGSWRGRDAVMTAIAANFESVTGQKPESEALIEQGNNIAMLIREEGRWKQTGKPYRVRGVIWWTFDGERISKVEEFVLPDD
jgi:ketosteroid isomerase-like protein